MGTVTAPVDEVPEVVKAAPGTALAVSEDLGKVQAAEAEEERGKPARCMESTARVGRTQCQHQQNLLLWFCFGTAFHPRRIWSTSPH